MRRRAITIGVGMVLAMAGCERPAAPDQTPTATTVSPAVAFDLRTHCGIFEVKFEGRYYEAVHPLSDADGVNPPDGWGNPYQRGTMRILSATEAEFRDEAGHVVLFRLRPQATAAEHPCWD
jgi:hypothetical protein